MDSTVQRRLQHRKGAVGGRLALAARFVGVGDGARSPYGCGSLLSNAQGSSGEGVTPPYQPVGSEVLIRRGPNSGKTEFSKVYRASRTGRAGFSAVISSR